MALADVADFKAPLPFLELNSSPQVLFPSVHNSELSLCTAPILQGHIEKIDHGVSCGDHRIKFVHGTTTLAFKYKDGIVVSVDSRASAGSYIATPDVHKVLKINKYMLGTMAGGAADCLYWERVLSKHCRLFELRNKERMSVAAASKLLSNMLYNYKGMGISLGSVIAGYDKMGPGLYYIDNEGTRLTGDYFSTGSGSPHAYAILDRGYKFDMNTDEAIELGRRAIYHATYRDPASGGMNNLYHITKDGWEFVGAVDVTDLHDKYSVHATA